MHPAIEPIRLGADQAVALGVRDDGGETFELEVMQGVVHGGRNREIGQLDQQVLLLMDGVLLRILMNVLEILETQ